MLFYFSLGTKKQLYHTCRKYGQRNVHTHHPKVSSDRQGGELVRVRRGAVSHQGALSSGIPLHGETGPNHMVLYFSHTVCVLTLKAGAHLLLLCLLCSAVKSFIFCIFVITFTLIFHGGTKIRMIIPSSRKPHTMITCSTTGSNKLG